MASRAGLDLEETLVLLWNADFNDLQEPSDVINARRVPAAEAALDIVSHKSELKVDYWLEQTGLERPAFAEKLQALGIALPPEARKLPKGALRRLRSAFPTAGMITAGTLEDTSDAEEARLVWETIGKVRTVTLLAEREILSVHEMLEEDFSESDDPIFPPGVRDEGLLSSAVSRPETGLGDDRKYPTIEMAGAALFHSLIHNHPFHNGNKRTALVSLLVVLDANGKVLTYSQDNLFKFTLRTAAHGIVSLSGSDLADRETLAIARWIHDGIKDVARGERPLKWIRLKHILTSLGCTYRSLPGNRLVIERPIEVRRRFLPPRKTVLATQVSCPNDGSEAGRSTIHKIRHDLQLDEPNGCDSDAFYSGAAVIDSFIVEYRRILKRLAKL